MIQKREQENSRVTWRAIIRMGNCSYSRFVMDNPNRDYLYTEDVMGGTSIYETLMFNIPCEANVLHPNYSCEYHDLSSFFEENAEIEAPCFSEQYAEQEKTIYFDYDFEAGTDRGIIYGRIYADILLNLFSNSSTCFHCDQEPPNELALKLIDEAHEEEASRDEVPEPWSACFTPYS